MTIGFRQMTIGALATTLACLWATEAGAKSRTCEGQLWVFERLEGNTAGGGTLNTDPQRISRGIGLIATFEGRGTCKRDADGCRQRAADAIIECARDMWPARSSVGLPASCTNTSGNSIVTRVTLEGIFPGFQNTVLDHSRSFVCCSFNKSAAEVPAIVRIGIIGGTGCVSRDRAKNEVDILGKAVSWHAIDEGAKFQCTKVRQDHCKPPRAPLPGGD